MNILCAVAIDVDDIHHDLELFKVSNSLNHKLTRISDMRHKNKFVMI